MSIENNFYDERVDLLHRHVEDCTSCSWDDDGDGQWDPHFCEYGQALFDDVPLAFDPLAGMYPEVDDAER
jgi:hypothetical protein